MDMHTDTTAHLAAEEATTPARAAAASMGAAIGKKLKARRRAEVTDVAAPTERESSDQAQAAAEHEQPNIGHDLKHEAVAPAEAPSLVTLLVRRNTLFDDANLRTPETDLSDEELDKVTGAGNAIEQSIIDTPCRTVDDAVAKVATLVEFVREKGCPNQEDVEAVMADVSRILLAASDPTHKDKVERYDAHWVLVPHPVVKPLELPVDLAAIVAAAEEYDLQFVRPACKRHDAADTATLGEGRDDPALKKAEALAWDEMDNHCDVYRDIVNRILDQRPATPKELLNQVEAWGALLVKHFAWKTGADTLIGKLCMEDAIMVGEHMHASLQRMLGTDGVSPTLPSGPNTPLAQAVAIRDQARAAFWVNEDPELNEAVSKAEFAVFAAPASTIAEVLWKLGENMMEDKGAESHADGLEQTAAEGGLEAASAVGVYRDLERLAAAQRPSIVIAALDAKLAELYAVERQLGAAEGDSYDEVAYEAAVAKSGPIARALMATPARTVEDFQAKARAVDWACSGDWDSIEGKCTAQDFALTLVRELLGSSEAFDGSLNGRKAVAAAWSEARLAELERRIDHAISEIPFLTSREHGLTDDEFNKRLTNGDQLAAAIAALDGDDAVTQRLRIKALGWLSVYTPTVVFKDADTQEKLVAALMRSACKQSATTAAGVRHTPELLAAE